MNNKDHMENAAKHAPAHGKDDASKTKPETQHAAGDHKGHAGDHKDSHGASKDTHGAHKGTTK